MYNNIATIYLKVGNESTSKNNFWTTSKGNLPYLSYIFRKLEPLGIEFNTMYYYVKWALLFIETQKGKEGTKKSKYHMEIGET